MRKIILVCASLCAMVLLISAGPVMAQNVLWVGPNGNDGNACSTTAPCATFAGAIQKGGVAQINCLGSGNYGPLNGTTVSISGSITIDCGTGNVGNIASSSGTGIAITTSSAATIVLRHLALNGLGSGELGIDAGTFFSGTLIVEDCMIHGFTSFGIAFIPTGGRGLLLVSNSQVFSNGGVGITAQPITGEIASVTLNRVEVVANAGIGLFFAGAGVVAGTMRDSVVGENGSSGVLAQAGQVFFTIEESSIVDNLSNGIQTNSANAIVNVGARRQRHGGTCLIRVHHLVRRQSHEHQRQQREFHQHDSAAIGLWFNAEAASVGGLFHWCKRRLPDMAGRPDDVRFQGVKQKSASATATSVNDPGTDISPSEPHHVMARRLTLVMRFKANIGGDETSRPVQGSDAQS